MAHKKATPSSKPSAPSTPPVDSPQEPPPAEPVVDVQGETPNASIENPEGMQYRIMANGEAPVAICWDKDLADHILEFVEAIDGDVPATVEIVALQQPKTLPLEETESDDSLNLANIASLTREVEAGNLRIKELEDALGAKENELKAVLAEKAAPVHVIPAVVLYDGKDGTWISDGPDSFYHSSGDLVAKIVNGEMVATRLAHPNYFNRHDSKLVEGDVVLSAAEAILIAERISLLIREAT